MTEERMFGLDFDIWDLDAFLDMPMSTQALYFHLAARADDNGFVNSPRKIQRLINAKDIDFEILMSKRFLIEFETGVKLANTLKVDVFDQIDKENS